MRATRSTAARRELTESVMCLSLSLLSGDFLLTASNTSKNLPIVQHGFQPIEEVNCKIDIPHASQQ